MTMNSPAPAPPGLLGRAVLALGLLVGFYVLAIGIAAVLLLLPYLELRYTQRIHLQVAILAVITAAAILFAIVPRVERFRSPGPRLERGKHPALFAILDEVAEAAGQSRPREVYLVPPVNAFVADWGGLFGIGGRRILGIGLPVFASLTIRELRAVLAHEFGHYAGGDTRLGGIVHVTRSAIGRTLANLNADERRPSLLQRPFLAYGRMFLRVTQAVSRAQERNADRLAAKLVGPAALASALRKLAVLDSVFDSYISGEVQPAFNANRLPPLADGLVRYLRSSEVQDQYAIVRARVPEFSRKAVEQRPAGFVDFDSHPPLHERIEPLEAAHAALGDTAAGSAEDDALAITLLDDWLGLERELMAAMNPGRPRHEPIAWEDMAEQVYVPRLLERLQPVQDQLTGRTIADIGGPDAEGLMRRVLHRWMREPGEHPKMDAVELEMQGVHLLAGSVNATLHALGWSAHTEPGEQITMRDGDRSFEPGKVLADRFAGKVEAAEWQRRCAELAIGDLPITIPKPGESADASASIPAPELAAS